MADTDIKLYMVTMDCKDPYALAKFYADLLQWVIPFHDEDWACVGPPGTEQGAYPGITFQRNPAYVPPVWPEQPGAQQTMAHLDFAVHDLEAAVQAAVGGRAVLRRLEGHARPRRAPLLPVRDGAALRQPAFRAAIAKKS